MPFINEIVPVPTSIGRMELKVATDADGSQQAHYYYEVLDQFGNLLHQRQGSAVPHLLVDEIAALQALMVRVRGLAANTLPTP